MSSFHIGWVNESKSQFLCLSKILGGDTEMSLLTVSQHCAYHIKWAFSKHEVKSRETANVLLCLTLTNGSFVWLNVTFTIKIIITSLSNPAQQMALMISCVTLGRLEQKHNMHNEG